MNAAEGSLLSACSGPVTRRSEAKRSAAGVLVREVRARPGRRSTGKTRSSPCSISRHGRRTAIDIGQTLSCYSNRSGYCENAARTAEHLKIIQYIIISFQLLT